MSRETWLPAHALRSEGGVASLFTARASVVGSIWLLFCIPSAWSIASFVETDARASLSTLGQVFEGPDGKPVVVLEPQRWVGKPFDLPANIESFSDRESTDPLAVRQELKQGSWTVLLYHYGCPNCQRKIEDLRERKDSNTVLVEVAPDERRNYKLDFRIMRLSTRHKWLVTTPVVIEVKNGVVQKIDTRKSS